MKRFIACLTLLVCLFLLLQPVALADRYMTSMVLSLDGFEEISAPNHYATIVEESTMVLSGTWENDHKGYWEVIFAGSLTVQITRNNPSVEIPYEIWGPLVENDTISVEVYMVNGGKREPHEYSPINITVLYRSYPTEKTRDENTLWYDLTEEDVPTVDPSVPKDVSKSARHWYGSVKTFETARNDLRTGEDNQVCGADEWEYMIRLCEKLENAGFDRGYIGNCYAQLATCENEQMRELVLMMFSSDLLDIVRKDSNEDGSIWEGSSYSALKNGRVEIVLNDNYIDDQTLFHELGHAIDLYIGQKEGNTEGFFSVTEEQIDNLCMDIEAQVYSVASEVVGRLFKDAYFAKMGVDDKNVTRDTYVDYLTHKALYHLVPSMPPAEEVYPITSNALLDEAYRTVISMYRDPYDAIRDEITGTSMEVDYFSKGNNLVSQLDQQAYRTVVSDIIGGVTNNLIVAGCGHFFDDTQTNTSYWYNQENMFQGWRTSEVWADYVQSIVADLWHTDEIVQEFLPSYDAALLLEQFHSLMVDSLTSE